MRRLATLAHQVATIQRQATALITSRALATIQRAWDVITWNENLHPRGPNGRFIGGAGLQAERELFHMGRAFKAFQAQTEHLSDAAHHAAEAKVAWRGTTGLKAVQTRQGVLRQQADTEARTLPLDAATIQQLRYLRDQYRLIALQANRPPATVRRMQDEAAVIDRYLKRAGVPLTETTPVSPATLAGIRQQIDTGLAKEATVVPPAPEQAATAAPGLVTSARTPRTLGTSTTPALGLTPPTTEELAAHREQSGTTGMLAQRWPQFWRGIRNNPRSAIGDGAILAPQPTSLARQPVAEGERRAASPIYRRLMEDGEVTFRTHDGQMLTMRHRYHLGSQYLVYDVFVGNATQPAKGYGTLTRTRWTNQDAFDFIEQQAAAG
jgi:hypothetical protein